MTMLESAALPLENGDRMTRAEFHRRYKQHPEIRRAELIEGVVYVSSPVRFDHSRPDGRLMRWLGSFAGTRTDMELLPNTTVRLDADNEVQPDISMMRVSPDEQQAWRYVERAPELVVEISGSSASYDLHEKMNVYRRTGVQEYIVWRVYDAAIDWFELREGVYARLEPDERGVIESRVFPGLRLAVAKMLAGDLAGVLAEQQLAE